MLQVCKDQQVRLAFRVQRGQQEWVLRVLLVRRAHRELLALREHKVHKDQQGQQVLKEHKEIPEQLELKAFKERLDQQA